MKKTITLLCILLSSLFCCEAFAAGDQMELLREEGGKMVFKVTVYGKKKETARLACAKILDAMCYDGIAGSNLVTQPMITPEKLTDSKVRSKVDDLIKNYYDKYCTEITTLVPYGKDIQKKKCETFRITVNQTALRRALEREGLTRKFGF